MTTKIFAANWKMQIGPDGARAFFETFLRQYEPAHDREVWFFPPAVSLPVVAAAVGSRTDLRAGAQNVYWEPKGAFTGEISVALAKEAGARAALVGHSERRHVFGESIEDTARKVDALLELDLTPTLCVGETLEERDTGTTEAIVLQQLAGGLGHLTDDRLSHTVVAYEPVWAIGTGKNATPEDAATVHRSIRAWLRDHGHMAPKILYGGSVKATNIAQLMAEQELDGVLVGGASLDPAGWAGIAQT